MLWYVGLIFCGKQGIEKTMEFATAYETDVTDLHGHIRVPWVWFPQSMSECRILDCKLFAKDVVVGHLGPQGSKDSLNFKRPCVRVTGVGKGRRLGHARLPEQLRTQLTK